MPFPQQQQLLYHRSRIPNVWLKDEGAEPRSGTGVWLHQEHLPEAAIAERATYMSEGNSVFTPDPKSCKRGSSVDRQTRRGGVYGYVDTA